MREKSIGTDVNAVLIQSNFGIQCKIDLSLVASQWGTFPQHFMAVTATDIYRKLEMPSEINRRLRYLIACLAIDTGVEEVRFSEGRLVILIKRSMKDVEDYLLPLWQTLYQKAVDDQVQVGVRVIAKLGTKFSDARTDELIFIEPASDYAILHLPYYECRIEGVNLLIRNVKNGGSTESLTNVANLVAVTSPDGEFIYYQNAVNLALAVRH